MKKIMILVLSVITLMGLAGCSESSKLNYVAEMTDAVPDLTGAYVGLHDLYTSPLSYTTEEWKTEFRKHKGEIEEEYNEIKGLTPLDSLTDAHNSLLQVLEITIDTNQVIDEQIQKGEKIDFANALNKLNELKAGLDQSLTELTSLK